MAMRCFCRQTGRSGLRFTYVCSPTAPTHTDAAIAYLGLVATALGP